MLNKKIVVIGAGHGGMRAAKVLASAGADVTVYEKSARDRLSHEWRDTVESKLFTDLGIPVPEGSYKAEAVTFIPPFADTGLYIWTAEEKKDYSVRRRIFATQLMLDAEQSGAKFVFETPVESLIIDHNLVKGIVVGGEEIHSDLVIDSCGIFSPFRASLPAECGVTAMPGDDEYFTCWHAVMEKNPGVPDYGEEKWPMHLKYMGEKGVCWCGCEPDGYLNVLTGVIGPLDEERRLKLYNGLKHDYPIMSDNIVVGGYQASIPVRYPLPKPMTYGYIAIGDAAFMPIPLVGCGIATSIRAGQMLGEAIVNSGSVSVITLWNYHVKYYRSIGASCCLIDCLKRVLLSIDNDDLRYLMTSGIITNDDIKAIFSGNISLISASELLSRLKKAGKAMGTFGQIAGALAKGIAALTWAKSIPSHYDAEKIAAWVKAGEKIYR